MCPMPNYLPKLDFHVDVDIDVGHHVHLHVGHRVGYCIGHHNVVSTICEGSEMLTEWKSESITDGCPYGPNYVPTDGRT